MISHLSVWVRMLGNVKGGGGKNSHNRVELATENFWILETTGD